MKMFTYLTWILFHVTCINGITRPTNIVLQNNGYMNILVSIHPSVPEDKNLIDDIKDMFKEGSSYLYEATEKRAYFKDVTILVPASWSLTSDTASEVYDNADIEFTTSTYLTSGHTRQTRSYSGCGSPGIRIHFAPELFDTNRSKVYDIDTIGPRGRLLVHEWAHFRWGVYDEYAKDGEQQFYDSPKTGKVVGVACNSNIRGINYRLENGQLVFCRNVDPATGRFPDECRYLPYNRRNTRVSASIMHRVYVPSIKYFCNDDDLDSKRIHNYEAPNKQNRLCGQRSTWSVIQDSPDFKNNNNPPRDIPDTTPTFKVVKAAKTRRVVLALDTSGSMMNDDASNRLRQATADYIHNGISEDTEVGIVSFNHKAKIIHPMTTISSTEDRERIKRSLPQKSGGATSFGNGLKKAIELLTKNGQNATGAEVIILSDGKETSHPKINDVADQIQSSGAIVNIFAFNQETDENLSDTAHSSGGRFYFDNDQDKSTTFSDALFKLRRDPSLNRHESSILMKSDSAVIWKGKELLGSAFVDADIGRNTIFTVLYTTEEPLISITSPTGRVYNSRYPEYKIDHSFNTVRIEIPEIAEIGEWKYSVKVKDKYPQKVTISITSKPLDDQRHPIFIDGGLSSVSMTTFGKVMIWAEVGKGSHPVLGMEVTAIIDRPFAAPTRLTLNDNGAGADITKDDGVYSRYFTQFSGYGRYSVKIEVKDRNGRVHLKKTVLTKLDYPVIDVESGVIIREKRETHLEEFQTRVSRSTIAGNFLHKTRNITLAPLTREELDIDLISPVRITDLAVMKTSHQDKTVVLQWTAPGDDLDSDTAFKYDILMANNAEDMLKKEKSSRILSQEDVMHGNLMAPQEAGIPETFILKIPLTPGLNTSFVFSVRAVDEQGNMGENSNFVTIGFGYVPDFTHSGYQPIEVVTQDPYEPSTTDINVLVGIVGSLAAAILFTIILSLFLHKFVGNDKNILHHNLKTGSVV
ncbi:hypothetical protein LOTGIDRAFT_229148 [Lottia gigantea]|uniref:VWFA domain-containing protein n=1 Tax=Lottia gigantea TaxID=225164 RepID=V3ZDR8_LOTGI|nr:hypothetical protein LOTGIDRAFT_229148 [Lottia gigantea]ESO89263.1 hypothetical protein LOTGIDRAFT_229148 [Lottia gigantea]